MGATSAGNAAGSLGTFLAQLSLAPALIHHGVARSGLMLGFGAALGAVGGGLGIMAGVAEIKQGKAIKEAGSSSRTLVMGCLDITSGVTSLAGAGAMAMGAAPVGIALMMLANVVDLAGIGVDYLWKRMSKKSGQEAPPLATPPEPATKPAAAETSGGAASPVQIAAPPESVAKPVITEIPRVPAILVAPPEPAPKTAVSRAPAILVQTDLPPPPV